jgi:periplasmic protein TonB
MFELATVSSGFAGKRLWNTCLGFTGEALLVACAAMAPLVSPQALPHSRAIMAWLLPVAPAGPAPARDAAKARPTRPVVERLQNVTGQLVEPATIPEKPAIIVDEPVATSGYTVSGGIGGGERNSVSGGVLKSILDEVPPTPAVEVAPAPRVTPPAPVAPKQVRVGGVVQMARLIHRVDPRYPTLARQARVSGVVELAGIIGTDGHIRELKPLSGHPLLTAAALEAVRQWIYEPTRLNGEPVELIATISVTFRLN